MNQWKRKSTKQSGQLKRIQHYHPKYNIINLLFPGGSWLMACGGGLAKQKQIHSEAFHCISKALDLDPVSPSQAVVFYRKGLMIMKQAIGLQFSAEEEDEAKVLNKKMQKNLIMVENRLRELEKSQRTSGGIVYTPNRSSNTKSEVIDLTSSPPNSPNRNSAAPIPHSSPKPTTLSNRNPTYTSNIPTQRKESPQAVQTKNSLPTSQVTATRTDYPELRGIDKSMQQLIMREIVDNSPGIAWDDIVGQELAKQSLFEIVILPSLRPDLFTGLRTPTKGLLLFGPPGNGKTLLAKAVATECKGTFFSISASSLVSKYVGDSEKLVRALFTIARLLQPAIIFIDEIDSMLGERSSDDTDSSRRLKTEFLVQLDGATTSQDDKLLVMAATNRPWDLDEAVLRRLGKRVFINLPEIEGRLSMIRNLLGKHQHALKESDFQELARRTEGYSGSDITQLCKDASMGPIRELGMRIKDTPLSNVRPIQLKDFIASLSEIRPSSSVANLEKLSSWNQSFGSTRI